MNTDNITAGSARMTNGLEQIIRAIVEERDAVERLIESLADRITKLEARECLRELESLRSGRDERDTDIREMDERLDKLSNRLDDVECSLEDKLDSMDLDERFTEALQNVTFTVNVE